MHSQEDRALQQLWGLHPAPARGPKARWTLSEVAAAAVDLADEVGLEALTLARLAARLSMTTTAIYRYAESKGTLVELMVDAAIGDPPELDGVDWRDRCRSWVAALSATYAAHPWLSDVRPTRMPTQPRAYAWIDALVGAVERDIDAEPLRFALLLDSVVRTYATLERTVTQSAPPSWLGAAIATRFPRLALAGEQDTSDARDELGFAVEAILQGVG